VDRVSRVAAPILGGVREIIEFRIPEKDAQRVLGPGDGTVLGGSVRKIELAATDDRVALVRDAEAAYRARGDCFFTSWNTTRHYGSGELHDAGLLQLLFTRTFEPAGADCGTRYSEAEACPNCGAGDRQIGFLRLDLRRLPKQAAMARSIADEWVVNQRLGEALVDAGLTGFALRPVLHRHAPLESVDLTTVPSGRRLLEAANEEGIDPGSWEFSVWINRTENHAMFESALAEAEELSRSTSPPKNLPVWHQLEITAPPVPVAPPTRYGETVFDEDPEGRYRCPLGHVAGLNLLSEIHVLRTNAPETDFAVTRELEGRRVGLLRPAPRLLVSQRTRAVLEEHCFKGFRFEVAHLVGNR
jgi:hypothetical protein